ncbi:Protein T2 [Coelomomyces lativittatus]|nr:Protein T2 [Coelomomyces lativittatus]
MQKGQPQLGWVFLRHLDFFKMYTEFINGFDVGMELLEVYTKKKKAFAMFLESCRKAPGHNQVNLQAYLLLPIQRIPRYQLLLSQLLKYTPSDHPDFTPLTLSVKGIQKKANELNEAKRAHENHFQLIKLVLRLPPPFDLLLPHRKLWRQGSLFLWKCKANNTVFLINLVYHFALFNDLFLQLKKPSRILSLLSPTTHPSSISSSSSSSMSTSSPLLLPPPSSPPLLSVSSPRTLNSSTPFTSMPSSSPSTSFPSPSLSQSRFSNPRSSSPKWMPSTTPSNSMFRWFQSPKSYPRKYQVIQAYSFDQRPPSVFLDAQAGVLMVQFFETELYFQDHGQNLNAWWADFQRILLKP